MKIEKIAPTGEWVVLKAVEVKTSEIVKTAGGIILPNGQPANGQNINANDGKKTVDIFVHAVGNKVPEDCGYKVGDCVLIDNYDAQTICDDAEQMFAICHYSKIKAVLECSR